MTSSVHIDLSEFAEVLTAFAKIGTLGKVINEGGSAAADVVVSHAKKDYVPVDTGNLKKSITKQKTSEGWEIGPTMDYGLYVEIGTSRMAAQPYMAPASDNHQDEIREAFAKIIEKHVQETFT